MEGKGINPKLLAELEETLALKGLNQEEKTRQPSEQPAAVAQPTPSAATPQQAPDNEHDSLDFMTPKQLKLAQKKDPKLNIFYGPLPNVELTYLKKNSEVKLSSEELESKKSNKVTIVGSIEEALALAAERNKQTSANNLAQVNKSSKVNKMINMFKWPKGSAKSLANSSVSEASESTHDSHNSQKTPRKITFK